MPKKISSISSITCVKICLLTEAIEARKVVLENEALNAALKEESLDVTLPGKQMPQGTRHILTQVMDALQLLLLINHEFHLQSPPPLVVLLVKGFSCLLILR
jgi:phenylalanyl-tRNA synthetase alpha subunit